MKGFMVRCFLSNNRAGVEMHSIFLRIFKMVSLFLNSLIYFGGVAYWFMVYDFGRNFHDLKGKNLGDGSFIRDIYLRYENLLLAAFLLAFLTFILGLIGNKKQRKEDS